MKADCKTAPLPKGGTFRPVLVRWRRIAVILNRAHAPLILSRIAAELEVSRKTVERDLDAMRNSLDLPIVATQRGVYLTKKVTLCAFCGSRADKSKTHPC